MFCYIMDEISKILAVPSSETVNTFFSSLKRKKNYIYIFLNITGKIEHFANKKFLKTNFQGKDQNNFKCSRMPHRKMKKQFTIIIHVID